MLPKKSKKSQRRAHAHPRARIGGLCARTRRDAKAAHGTIAGAASTMRALRLRDNARRKRARRVCALHTRPLDARDGTPACVERTLCARIEHVSVYADAIGRAWPRTQARVGVPVSAHWRVNGRA